jgi:predicted outer membrane repeat protein
MTIGFHQTTIEASRSILATGFKPSKSGMLGPGIYFATNYDATEFKRNQSTEGGAIFCAVLDMGRVREVVDKNDSLNYSKTYNSKYLRHGAGDAYDEFVVYSESQVVEYTIIVEQAAIDSYRAKNQRTFDFI